MGPVQGWAKAHSYTNPDLTRGLNSKEGRHRDHTNPNLTWRQRSKDGKQTDPSFEEPKERMHLENTLVGHLHQKAGHCGRH